MRAPSAAGRPSIGAAALGLIAGGAAAQGSAEARGFVNVAGGSSTDRTTLPGVLVHIWTARLPDDLAPGAHRVVVEGADEHGRPILSCAVFEIAGGRGWAPARAISGG